MAPGEYLVLLDMLAFISGSFYRLIMSVLDVYCSGSMVQEIAKILNWRTAEEAAMLRAGTETLELAEKATDDDDEDVFAALVDRVQATAQSAPKVSPAAPLSFFSSFLAGTAKNRRARRAKAAWSRSVDAVNDQAVSGLTKLLSKSRVDEVRTIMSSAKSDSTAAFRVATPTYSPEAAYFDLDESETRGSAVSSWASHSNSKQLPPLFQDLKVIKRDESGDVPVTLLPGGSLVFLETKPKDSNDSNDSKDSQFHQRAELALMKLLNGSIRPQSGVASCFPMLKSEVVTCQGESQLLMASLFENLLYGIAKSEYFVHGVLRVPADAKESVPTARQLWMLCRFVGLSDTLIGADFKEGWGNQHLRTVLSWVSQIDLVKLAMARALLRGPSILLLYRVGDGWPEAEQRLLVTLVKSFLNADHALQALTHSHQPKTRQAPRRSRTVLWSADDESLSRMLKLADYRLVLESPSLATLHPNRTSQEKLSA